MLGGELKKETEALIGAEALESLEKYNFTKGFFGANGITMNMESPRRISMKLL